MKPAKFIGKKTLQVSDQKMIDELKLNLMKFKINLNHNYNKFLNVNTIDFLSKSKYKFCISTFGKKYFLYITNYASRNYCFYINKKTQEIIYIRYCFEDKCFKDTLLDGELVKDNNNKWNFLIQDIILYAGTYVKSHPLDSRISLMQKFINEDYKKDTDLDVCDLDLVNYVECQNLEYIFKKSQESNNFKYRISGLLFKVELKKKDNCDLMYIFPSNRSNKDKDKSGINKKEISNVIENMNFEKEYGIIQSTDMPDIYKILDKNSNLISHLSVLKFRDSKILNQIFEEENEFILKIKCNKNNKWILNEDANLYDDFENYFINIKNRNKSELINYLYIK
jgi:hypothetical protein